MYHVSDVSELLFRPCAVVIHNSIKKHVKSKFRFDSGCGVLLNYEGRHILAVSAHLPHQSKSLDQYERALQRLGDAIRAFSHLKPIVFVGVDANGEPGFVLAD